MVLPTDGTTYAGIAGAPYPVSLGGRPYMVDLTKQSGFTERTIPLLRNQADNSPSIAEASLNPEDLLRRAAESYHLGTGQEFRDREDSSPYRFRDSDGVDPWTKWQLSLHWGTKSIKTLTASSESSVLSVGRYLYLLDGASVFHSSSDLDGTVTWTTVTGTAAANNYACTNGYDVYIACGASGVYTTTSGAATASQLFTGTVNYCWFLKGRLLVANGSGILYNPTDFTTPPNALPAALLDLGSNWLWNCAADGLAHIYIGGYRADGSGSGDHSVIYKTAVKPDGTALDVPTVAATLPDGERITGMVGYLGYVVIGVDDVDGNLAGFRLAQVQGDGNLVLGPKVYTGAQQTACFEPQDRYVWFNWSKDTGNQGLGRMDLSRFTEPMVPAFAKDIFYAGASLSAATAVVTHQGRRVFRVDNDVLACEDRANRAAEGNIYLGKITYGVPDNKVAMFIDVSMSTTSGTDGSVGVYVSVDGGARTIYGALQASGTVDLSAVTGREIEVSLRLIRSLTNFDLTPIVNRVTLRSYIAANRSREWIVPLIVRPKVAQHGAGDTFMDTRAEIDAIAAFIDTVQVFKMGTLTTYVRVKDYEFQPEYLDEQSGRFGGTLLVKLQEVT